MNRLPIGLQGEKRNWRAKLAECGLGFRARREPVHRLDAIQLDFRISLAREIETSRERNGEKEVSRFFTLASHSSRGSQPNEIASYAGFTSIKSVTGQCNKESERLVACRI